MQIADTADPLNFTTNRLFEEGDPRNSPFVNLVSINNDLLYYWVYDKSNIYSSINTYNIYTKETDSLVIINPVEYLGQLLFRNNGVYLNNWKDIDKESGKMANDGFYKYNFYTEEIDLIYKFDINYSGVPELIELTDDTYALKVTNKYYLFKNDVFYKIQDTPGVNCEECTDRLESFTYNKYNDYFYYTTKGSCLFRSDEFYNEFISDPKAGVLSLANESLPNSYILNDNHINFDTKQGEIIQSISLYNLSGSTLDINDWQQSGTSVNINLQSGLSTGVYMLIVTTNQRVQEVKLMKR